MTYRKLLVSLGLASMLCYAAAVWSLHQHRTSQYNVEQFVVASAFSHVRYGTPIGAAYRGILDRFAYQAGNIQATIRALSDTRPEAGRLEALWSTLPDGQGSLMVAIVSLMFETLGVTLVVFPAMAIGISAVGVAGFLLRFRDGRLFAIPLHFFALIALLLSPLTTSDYSPNEFPVGGFRYFGLLALLPAIHLTFEILDRANTRSAGGRIAAVMQIFILTICLFIRTATIYLVLATFSLIAIGLWTRAADVDPRRMIAKAGAFILCGVLIAGAVYAAAPADYRTEGRVTGTFWHRLLVGLGTNPAWPFGDLATRYSLCAPPYSPPMSAGIRDSNGGCIWTQYVRQHGMPDSQLMTGLYGTAYERVVRDAYLRIVEEFPGEVLKTYFYYKFVDIGLALRSLTGVRLDLVAARYPMLLACGVIQFVLLLIAAWYQRTFHFRGAAAAAALFLLWSILPIVLAWPAVHTVVDLAYWCILTFLLAAFALLERVVSPRRRSSNRVDGPART